MKTKFFDDFFYSFSKIVIFFPIFFIIFGLILKFNQKQKDLTFNKNVINPNKISFLAIPTISKTTIDLKGPWRCFFENRQATLDAYIKDRKIKLEIKNDKTQIYFLINNDCVYQWEKGQFSGDKSCGIGSYLSFAESIFKNNNQVFFDLFLKQFKEFNQSSFSLENICKKENIDENIFLAPTTILFKNKPLNL